MFSSGKWVVMNDKQGTQFQIRPFTLPSLAFNNYYAFKINYTYTCRHQELEHIQVLRPSIQHLLDNAKRVQSTEPKQTIRNVNV